MKEWVPSLGLAVLALALVALHGYHLSTGETPLGPASLLQFVFYVAMIGYFSLRGLRSYRATSGDGARAA